MGFFADIASEARRGIVQAPPPARQTAAAPPPAPESKPALPAAAPEMAAAQPEPVTEAPPEPAPAPEQPEPEQPAAQPAIDLTPADDAADDAERRKAHEATEAKRKAEFDAKQAAKNAARQKQLDRIAAMSDEDVAADAVKRIGADTEKLTRRNMKEAVCEHVQALCRKDSTFARRTMLPEKSMINCFKYIYRMAQEYAEQEMKDNGIERTGVYGLDVPNDLCFQWAVSYYDSDDIKEDHKDDEKFVPKPYVPSACKKAQGKTAKKPSGAAKPHAKKLAETGMEQISLM